MQRSVAQPGVAATTSIGRTILRGMLQDIPFHAPGMGSTALFLAVIAFVSGCVVLAAGVAREAEGAAAVRDGRLRAATAVILWLMLTAALPASGLVGLAPPTMAGFIVLSTVVPLGLALSKEGRRWATQLPLWSLIGFQAFRLPLEIVLHWWYGEGTIPVEMTWDGYNLDVITGIVSLIAGLVLVRVPNKAVAWVATAVGSLLLANVIVTAFRSAPLPVPGNFGAEPPLLLALYAPYAWIVPVCVAGALAGHVIAIRKLLGG